MSWGTEKCSLLWRCCAQFVHWICINQMLKIMTFLPTDSHFTWDLFWVWGLSRTKACKCCFCFLMARAKTYIPPLLKVADHSAFCSWVIPMCLFYIHSEVFFTLIAVVFYTQELFCHIQSNFICACLLFTEEYMSSNLTGVITVGATSHRK